MELRDVIAFGTAEADNDELLLECFQDHEAYLAAKGHKKFLIVGRKGSGKTAIFRKLVSDAQGNQYCHGHSFSKSRSKNSGFMIKRLIWSIGAA